MSRLRRFLRRLGESGPLYTIQLSFDWLIPEKISRWQSIIYMEKPIKPNKDSMILAPDIRWANEMDILKLQDAGYTEDDLQQRFKRKELAAIIEHDGKILGASWYVPNRHLEYFWLNIEIPPGDLWNWDIWITPYLRGQGHASRLLAFAHAQLAVGGDRKIYCSINRLNRNSIRAFTKAGYQKIGELTYLRFGHLIFIRNSKNFKFWCWRPGHSLTLHLQVLNGQCELRLKT